MTPKAYVDWLCEYKASHVFNPYSQTDRNHDLDETAAHRRENLVTFIENAKCMGPRPDMWIAQELGYRGGRITGVALTDDHNWHKFRDLFGTPTMILPRLPMAKYREHTARKVWEMIDKITPIGTRIFPWNVFPFHSFSDPKDQTDNRAHAPDEYKVGVRYLAKLIQIIEPRRFVAIGEIAWRALEEIDCRPRYKVRHPAHGGQTKFGEAISSIYGVVDPDLFEYVG